MSDPFDNIEHLSELEQRMLKQRVERYQSLISKKTVDGDTQAALLKERDIKAYKEDFRTVAEKWGIKIGTADSLDQFIQDLTKSVQEKFPNIPPAPTISVGTSHPAAPNPSMSVGGNPTGAPVPLDPTSVTATGEPGTSLTGKKPEAKKGVKLEGDDKKEKPKAFDFNLGEGKHSWAEMLKRFLLFLTIMLTSMFRNPKNFVKGALKIGLGPIAYGIGRAVHGIGNRIGNRMGRKFDWGISEEISFKNMAKFYGSGFTDLMNMNQPLGSESASPGSGAAPSSPGSNPTGPTTPAATPVSATPTPATPPATPITPAAGTPLRAPVPLATPIASAVAVPAGAVDSAANKAFSPQAAAFASVAQAAGAMATSSATLPIKFVNYGPDTKTETLSVPIAPAPIVYQMDALKGRDVKARETETAALAEERKRVSELAASRLSVSNPSAPDTADPAPDTSRSNTFRM